MKNYCVILALLVTFLGFSQNYQKEFDEMVAGEMKSASNMAVVAVNPNTLNYDLTYQKLEFTVNPAVFSISGKVTHTFTALSDMTTVTFDLYKKPTPAFTITSVKMNGSNLTFSYNPTHELVITLPTTLTTGNAATVEIVYNGVPINSGSQQGFYTGTHAGTPVLWTLSEPFGARSWWPCKNDLNDKVASTDIYITAPIAYKSVANGLEIDRIENGANATTHFFHNYPISAYLIAIAVTNYQTFSQTGGTVATGTFPITNYLYPEEFNAVTTGTTTPNALLSTPSIINFYETVIGPYPFRNEKYGHARANLNGGMEHSTVSFMNSWGRGLIAHEMAHQWFGDKITCGTWKDIWLNESITEYMSGCYVEFIDPNPSAFVNWKGSRINAGLSYAGTDNNLYLTDAQAMNVNRIFDQPITYYKGALVTNMLRFKMGSANFFQALRNYLSDLNFAYKYATTNDMRLKLEEVNGTGSLVEFFNDWVYGLGHPTYTINAQNTPSGQVKFTVNQTQSDPSVSYFEMPIPVRVLGSGGQQQDFILNNTFDGQDFFQNVPFQVTSVVFDPNKEIFSENNSAVLASSNFDFLSNSISVSPNPASNQIDIKIPSSVGLKSVSVYNSIGQKVLESNSGTLFVTSLSSGIYALSIETSEGTFHKKFIKN
jgi:aminopeptidase N